ncbi:hypothetical protein HZC08_01680 [Candidatus Micrarchaeota archaeon]|nr:hypothetical protein [Candidatus Micrarchaeota archaeon]
MNKKREGWGLKIPVLKENGELNGETQAAIGTLKEYAREMIAKKYPKLKNRKLPMWFVSEKLGIVITTGTYAPDDLEKHGEKSKDGNVIVVNLAFHVLGDLEASRLNKPIKLPVSGNTKKLQLLFDDFEIVGPDGLPTLWNRERGFGAVPYPYVVTEEEQKSRGSSAVLRGFLKSKEAGKYEEIRLIIYHLDKQKVKEGDYIDIGHELGTGHFIPPPKSNGYFCIAAEVAGKRVPITDLIKAGREFVPLSDLQKLPKSLVEDGILSIRAPEEKKLKQIR